MKVLQINAVYSKSSTGRTTREMHEYFLTHGIESYVAAPDLAGLEKNCFRIGCFLDHKFHALYCRITGKQAYASYFSTKKLIKWMSLIKPDVVILRNLHGNYINLPILTRYLSSKRIPTILVLHDSWFVTGGCTYYVAPKCYKWKNSCGECPVLHNDMHSWFFDRTSTVLKDRKKMLGSIKPLSIIGVSKWVADDALLSVLQDAFCIQHIYNWIDLQVFSPKDRNSIRSKYGFNNEQFLILGVSAAWSEAKGVNIFHALADILPSDIKIILVGKSDNIPSKRENVIYYPPTNNVEQLAELYAMADVFVNPTLQETFGKTTAEALSCGTPVVAYDSTATPELVGRDCRCGYLVDSFTPEAFAEKILQVYKNTSKYYSLECRKRAESMFDKEQNLKMYIDLMKEMIVYNQRES